MCVCVCVCMCMHVKAKNKSIIDRVLTKNSKKTVKKVIKIMASCLYYYVISLSVAPFHSLLHHYLAYPLIYRVLLISDIFVILLSRKVNYVTYFQARFFVIRNSKNKPIDKVFLISKIFICLSANK